jgi:hypothetical protein
VWCNENLSDVFPFIKSDFRAVWGYYLILYVLRGVDTLRLLGYLGGYRVFSRLTVK